MRQTDLTQLELLSRIDRLIARCRQWPAENTAWEPLEQARLFLDRVLPRVQSVRERLETPLVVAMFGGTGTGKSSLVNALLGIEASPAGRQRPTTLQPQLLIHPAINLDLLDLPREECQLQRLSVPILEDLVIVDCPDPDTTEQADAASNLERLRRFLPHCDVLIYTSTQQKYRSASVQKELRDAAAGCKLVFVQTHADRDSDIRADWKEHLREWYEVPEMFFVDSPGSLRRQQEGLPAEGEMARLQSFLMQQLSESNRGRIRRDNVLDLLYAALMRMVHLLQEKMPAVEQLEKELTESTKQLQIQLSTKLQDDLLAARQLWERRLTESVVKRWGSTPFSWLLRLYSSFGAFLGSLGLMRARTTAHVALLGVSQGLRVWKQHQQEQQFESVLNELDEVSLTTADLTGQQLVLNGYARSAGFDISRLPEPKERSQQSLSSAFQREFFQDVRREVDLVVERLAEKNSSGVMRCLYDVLFLIFPAFLLIRIGKNFFWDSLFYDVPILSADFYLPAGVFFTLWCGLFLMVLIRRLRKGLKREVRQLVERLLSRQFQHELFPLLQQECHQARRQLEDLQELVEECHSLRLEEDFQPQLGARKLGTLN